MVPTGYAASRSESAPNAFFCSGICRVCCPLRASESVPVIHVIHREDRGDYLFVRLAKGDTICLQAIDRKTGNRRNVNHLWLMRRRLVPFGNCLGRSGSVDRIDRIEGLWEEALAFASSGWNCRTKRT